MVIGRKGGGWLVVRRILLQVKNATVDRKVFPVTPVWVTRQGDEGLVEDISRGGRWSFYVVAVVSMAIWMRSCACAGRSGGRSA